MSTNSDALTAVVRSSGDATSVHASFVAGHMARTRRLVVVIVGVAAISAAAMLGLGGSTLGRALMVCGLVVVVAAAVVLARLTADPARFDMARGTAAWIALSVGITLVGSYFGVVSGAAAVHVIAITFATLAHDSRIGLWTAATAVASTAVLGGLIVSGTITDPGLLRFDHLSPWRQAIFVGAELAVLSAAYVVAAISRRATRDTVADLDVAIRSVSRRDALLDEARAELDRTRRVGDPGRFTDQVLGSYRLGTLLGRGAMGEVYAAVHIKTGIEAAVKLMRREALGDTHALTRFEREGQLLVGLRAAHVVQVFEIGGIGAALPYIAMERVHGQDLATVLRERPRFDDASTIALITQVARGLDAAHAHGVVHRDLKPQNLMWQPAASAAGAWVIIDFGVARSTDDGHTLTADRVVGTPAYMAPEQADHGVVGPAADCYSLAVVAFRVLTGELPHGGGDSIAMLHRIVSEPPRLPTEVEPDLPDELDLVFAIGLARNPKDRYASCAELAAALAAALGGRLPPRLQARGLALLHQRHRARRDTAPTRRRR